VAGSARNHQAARGRRGGGWLEPDEAIPISNVIRDVVWDQVSPASLEGEPEELPGHGANPVRQYPNVLDRQRGARSTEADQSGRGDLNPPPWERAFAGQEVDGRLTWANVLPPLTHLDHPRPGFRVFRVSCVSYLCPARGTTSSSLAALRAVILITSSWSVKCSWTPSKRCP